MRIITAADRRFSAPLALLCEQAERFGLPVTAYDLGGLGWGIPWEVSDREFVQRGRYAKSDHATPTALHKPRMIRDAMHRRPDESLVYFDADAIPLAAPRTAGFDADVGLVIRRADECKANHDGRDKSRRRWQGMFNAGVMFFGGTRAAKRWVDAWELAMGERGDQFAMNELANPECRVIEANEWWQIDGVSFQALPEEWNCRTWPVAPSAKVAHLIGGRHRKYTQVIRSQIHERHGSEA